MPTCVHHHMHNKMGLSATCIHIKTCRLVKRIGSEHMCSLHTIYIYIDVVRIKRSALWCFCARRCCVIKMGAVTSSGGWRGMLCTNHPPSSLRILRSHGGSNHKGSMRNGLKAKILNKFVIAIWYTYWSAHRWAQRGLKQNWLDVESLGSKRRGLTQKH